MRGGRGAGVLEAREKHKARVGVSVEAEEGRIKKEK